VGAEVKLREYTVF